MFAAHPLAVAAGQQLLIAGANAIDALIASQAAIAVVASEACGLGGDAFILVHEGAEVIVVNGADTTPLAADGMMADGAQSVTVPGMVDSWDILANRAVLGLTAALARSIRLAREGILIDLGLAKVRDAQAARLNAGGAADWPLMRLAAGDKWVQSELACSLERAATQRWAGLYAGPVAAEMIARIAVGGGAIGEADLAPRAATLETPLALDMGDARVDIQPPVSQGVLFGMALAALTPRDIPAYLRDHSAIEATQAAFAHRDDADLGAALYDIPLTIDMDRASLKGGVRSYLHTAGVATADASGLTAVSLVSIFDDFSLGVFCAQCGLRAEQSQRWIYLWAQCLCTGQTSGPHARTDHDRARRGHHRPVETGRRWSGSRPVASAARNGRARRRPERGRGRTALAQRGWKTFGRGGSSGARYARGPRPQDCRYPCWRHALRRNYRRRAKGRNAFHLGGLAAHNMGRGGLRQGENHGYNRDCRRGDRYW